MMTSGARAGKSMPSGAAKEMDSPAPPMCRDLIQGIGCIRPFAFAARPSGPAQPTGFPSMARRLHLYISAFPDWEYVSAYAATGIHPQRTTSPHGYTPTGLHAAAQPNGGRVAHGRPRAMLPFFERGAVGASRKPSASADLFSKLCGAAENPRLRRGTPSAFPRTHCTIIKRRARASASAETRAAFASPR